MYIKAELFKLMKSNRFYGLIAFTVYEIVAMVIMSSRVDAFIFTSSHFTLTFIMPFLFLVIIPKNTIGELNKNTNKLLFTLDFSKKKWLLTNILFNNGVALYILLVNNIVNFVLLMVYNPKMGANEVSFYIINIILIISWILFSANLLTLIQTTYRKLTKGYKTLLNVFLAIFGIFLYSNMIAMYFTSLSKYYNKEAASVTQNFIVTIILLIVATIGLIIAELYLYSSQDV